jgi:peptidoglycan/xylan/chitin deacetylase (PgdA/CDA1 family)
VKIRSQLGSLRRQMISHVCSRLVPLANRGPIVSFCFDDFPRTALTTGGGILRSLGVAGSYYVAVGLMNKVNDLGEQFHREDLDAVLSDGHELASHTFSHISCRSVSAATFLEDVQKGRQAIEELTGRPDSGNFAFPFGDFTLNAKRLVGAAAVSCRSTWKGFNGPSVDLNLLRANSLYGGREECALVRKLILDNERKKSWLIFYSHDVQDTPSRFGCAPALLEFAVSCALQTSTLILTVAEVVASLTHLPDNSPIARAIFPQDRGEGLLLERSRGTNQE